MLQTEKETAVQRNSQMCPWVADIVIKIAAVDQEVPNESLLSPSSSNQNLFTLIYSHCQSVPCSSLRNIVCYYKKKKSHVLCMSVYKSGKFVGQRLPGG